VTVVDVAGRDLDVVGVARRLTLTDETGHRPRQLIYLLYNEFAIALVHRQQRWANKHESNFK